MRVRLRTAARTLRFGLLFPAFAACSTAGSTWMAEPLTAAGDSLETTEAPPALYEERERGQPARIRTLGADDANDDATPLPAVGAPIAGGRALGTFRNTYYDFPSEADYEGAPLELMNQSCKTLARVPQTFFEALCVQGSGTLLRGVTVSFAKRDCACAPVCPKTGQKICFDELDAREYPWGRGATGKAITPLLTVAVDPKVIPMGTALYVPELDGLPREVNGAATHDGCFIAQDKGLAVVGNHVDFFTGHRDLTALWNRRVPSNRGVTVVLDSPRCARVAP